MYQHKASLTLAIPFLLICLFSFYFLFSILRDMSVFCQQQLTCNDRSICIYTNTHTHRYALTHTYIYISPSPHSLKQNKSEISQYLFKALIFFSSENHHSKLSPQNPQQLSFSRQFALDCLSCVEAWTQDSQALPFRK